MGFEQRRKTLMDLSQSESSRLDLRCNVCG
jgi:hypothetical protein